MRTPTVFTFGRWASAAAAALLLAAMLVYPGGTIRDPATHGYRISQNFLSDLSNTVAFGGQDNTRSRCLAMAGAWLLAAAFSGSTIGFVRLYGSSRTDRWLSYAAGVAGLAGCAAFIAASMAPGNRSLALHVAFGQAAFTACEVAALLFVVVTVRDQRFARGVPAAWLALAAIAAALKAVGRWGPGIATDYGLTVHVTAQKIVALAVWAIFIYQCREADRAVHS